jgi:hypothetical protein
VLDLHPTYRWFVVLPPFLKKLLIFFLDIDVVLYKFEQDLLDKVKQLFLKTEGVR